METTIVYRGDIGIMENKVETTIVYRGDIGIMGNEVETTIVDWCNIGRMENKMETTEVVYWGYILRGLRDGFLRSVQAWFDGV